MQQEQITSRDDDGIAHPSQPDEMVYPNERTESGSEVGFSLSYEDARRLMPRLAGTKHAVLIRRLLECLGLDEDLPSCWNLDHKLMQNVILSQSCPEAVPRSIGLCSAVVNSEDANLNGYLEGLFPKGFVVKPVRGSGSSRTSVLGSAEMIADSNFVSHSFSSYDGTSISEKFLVQAKIDAVREFRVHTIGRMVVPSLIFANHSANPVISAQERRAIVEFMSSILDRLPPNLAESLCGWDIGLLRSNEFKIIEGNFAGLHPVFMPGFHCSGHFQQQEWGAVNIAHLLAFLCATQKLKIKFNLDEPAPEGYTEIGEIAVRVQRWLDLIRISQGIHNLWLRTFERESPFCDSIRQKAWVNEASPMDRRYMEYVDWLRKMTIDLYENA